jgi:hypothetical protein
MAAMATVMLLFVLFVFVFVLVVCHIGRIEAVGYRLETPNDTNHLVR